MRIGHGMSTRWWIAGAVLAVVSTASNLAAAQPLPWTVRAPLSPDKVAKAGRVRLQYELGPGTGTCDSETLFRRLFKGDKAAVDPFTPTGPVEAVVDLRFENEAPGFRYVLEMRDLEGHILWRSESVERTCTDASDRAMIDLMVDVFSTTKPPPPEPAPPAPPPGVTQEDFARLRRQIEARLDAQDETIEELNRKVAALQKALDEQRKQMDLTGTVVGGLLMTANLTSNVGPGVYVGGGVRTGPIGVELELRAVLPAPVFLKPYDFDVSQVVGLLVPCGRYSWFFGCAVAGAGVEIHHDTNDSLQTGPETASGPLVQLGGRVGVEIPFGESPFGARAWGEVLYSTPQAGAYYNLADGKRLEWTRPDVSAFFGLGLVVKLGKEEAK